jgi:hypothetical protein
MLKVETDRFLLIEMNSKVAAFLFIVLILSSGVGYGIAASVVYQPQVSKLQAELTTSRTDLSAIQANYTLLLSMYNQLLVNYSKSKADYTALGLNYSALSSDYMLLNSSYSQLGDEYQQLNQSDTLMMQNYRDLSSDVTQLQELLYSYSFSNVSKAFSRVLNEGAVNETASTVLSVTGYSHDLWSSIEKIYDYITSNIAYVHDIDMPYISTDSYIDFQGFRYLTGFLVDTVENYYQTPGFTLEIKQGDCDDQAILAYAMIKYYMKYIYGTEYDLYTTYIAFSGGSAHLAVILPVQGGELCIIDPAGNYLTSSGGHIASKAAAVELQAYSDYWSSQTGPISYMELYRVAVTDGSYTLVARGTVAQVAAFF